MEAGSEAVNACRKRPAKTPRRQQSSVIQAINQIRNRGQQTKLVLFYF